ncbi:MAG: DUF1269 domain-containing protein [Chloroflexi bacterium]|nr:DUF1269 domain-containing protein [Chloroflexota bacterium]
MSVELFIAVFENSEEQAQITLQRTRELAKGGSLQLQNAAVIVKDSDGKVTTQDIYDVDAKHGAVFGAISGAVIGLLGGPIGAIAGAAAGAATGGATAKLADYGVSEEMIKEVRDSMPAGSSVIIAYVELVWVDKAIQRLEEAGAIVTHETLGGRLGRWDSSPSVPRQS